MAMQEEIFEKEVCKRNKAWAVAWVAVVFLLVFLTVKSVQTRKYGATAALTIPVLIGLYRLFFGISTFSSRRPSWSRELFLPCDELIKPGVPVHPTTFHLAE